MRMLNRILGLLAAAIGMAIAGFGPSVFELVSGRALPAPLGGDRDAMLVWSGVAFVRAFGAVLFAIGAALWATSGPVLKPRAIHGAFFIGFLFAALILWSQQSSVWSGAAGWTLVLLFFALAAVSLLRLMAPAEPDVIQPRA